MFTDREKQIYTAPNGSNYDPLALQRKLLLESGSRLNDALAVWGDSTVPEVNRLQAEDQLVTWSRRAFGFAPFDAENGVTDAVVLEALEHFLVWLEKKD